MSLNVMGTDELASRLWLTVHEVRALAAEPGFPEPAARISAGPIWETEVIEAWIVENRPDAAADPETGKWPRPPWH